jgi:hypothetical protein
MKTYDIGDTAIMTGEWKDVDGVYYDPASVSFSLVTPSGTVILYVYGTDVELQKSEVGKYYVSYVIDEVGFYRYRFSSGEGEESAANEWLYGIDSDTELTTLSHVKDWAEVSADKHEQDPAIQLCINAFSRYVLNRTSRATLGPYKTLTEIYNGNNAQTLFLKNFPIKELLSVMVNGASIPISSGYGVGGVVITGPYQNAIAIITSFTSGVLTDDGMTRGYNLFIRGINNVQVQYTAGYGYVPEDLEQAVCEAVSTNYKRKAWQDLASKSLSAQGGTGTTSYRDWHLSPGIERVIDIYSRKTY